MRFPHGRPLTGALVNAAWRDEIGPLLSPADKVSLAQRLGVSLRTLQRWTTHAGEQRNPLPPRFADNTRWLLEAPYRDRGDVVSQIGKEIKGNVPNEAGSEQCFTETFSTVGDALDWQIALVDGELDDFLSQSWTSSTLTLGTEGWEVEVCYDRTLFTSPGLAEEEE